MGLTVDGKKALATGLLEGLRTGSGTALIALFDGAARIGGIPLDHSACYVSESGTLLLFASGLGLYTAAGHITSGAITGRDGVTLWDGIEVQAGEVAVPGVLVVSSLIAIAAGRVSLTSGVIGW